MSEGIRLHSPALTISVIALFAALGSSVYAASKISGKAIRMKSLPGNRLLPHSVPANRLKPGVLSGASLPTPLTGADINELTLGQVPSAAHAETADSAQSAVDAQTALNAVNAIDARTVNGHSAGCLVGTRPFAGACWQASPNTIATAPDAAADCASHGGTLPGALELAAFAKQAGVNLDPGDEWSSDIISYSGEDVYGVATVSPAGVVRSGFFNGGGVSATKKYRCVIPLVT